MLKEKQREKKVAQSIYALNPQQNMTQILPTKERHQVASLSSY